jgi:hypothetical protein
MRARRDRLRHKGEPMSSIRNGGSGSLVHEDAAVCACHVHAIVVDFEKDEGAGWVAGGRLGPTADECHDML